ncbi:UDP-N-acetylmuramate dehydrogenase [Peptacetobacter hominis]|uniref:UDP-N-acetylenolpyruvoylglucosamine reductase n=1 Tax=Peptacetobacter hominis TaxID=2743610 RepID=A0A544QTN8_9FIRM|nr:UDP-N-acetylmuramate dehydrogenase [Peptacetobacter hominis]TQQ84059.1 UDP-N-acetylmuramate dehydrogenase [Peptacetobacter hominis]
MDKKKVYSDLKDILGEDKIMADEPMKKHTSFKVGGPADVLVRPETEEEIKEVFRYIKRENIPHMIIGNGSNLLVRDGGIRGVVVELADNFSGIEVEGNLINVKSGALLSRIGNAALKNELKGFEFAAGIPGSFGGAVAMNAGAYGGEIKDIVKSVRLMDEDGNIFELENKDMNFSYRRSIVTEKGYTVISAVIELEKGEYDDIKAEMDCLREKRVTKQPLNYASAGSTFKRPEGYFAGKLIQDSGLKGLALRDAQVSEKHSGFVINRGNATAKDLLDLMYIVKATVNAKFGVMLEEEVKIVGDDE